MAGRRGGGGHGNRGLSFQPAWLAGRYERSGPAGHATDRFGRGLRQVVLATHPRVGSGDSHLELAPRPGPQPGPTSRRDRVWGRADERRVDRSIGGAYSRRSAGPNKGRWGTGGRSLGRIARARRTSGRTPMVAHVDTDIAEVWKAYRAEPAVELRNQLVETYLPLVKYNAERIWSRLPDGVDLDDLISCRRLRPDGRDRRVRPGPRRQVRDLLRAAHPRGHARRTADDGLGAAAGPQQAAKLEEVAARRWKPSSAGRRSRRDGHQPRRSAIEDSSKWSATPPPSASSA